MGKHIGTIGHINHDKTTLLYAIKKVLEENKELIDAEKNDLNIEFHSSVPYSNNNTKCKHYKNIRNNKDNNFNNNKYVNVKKVKRMTFPKNR